MSAHQQLDADVGWELLEVARRGLELYVRDRVIYHPDLEKLPTAVAQPGCSFVT